MSVTIIWRERNEEVNLQLRESFDFRSYFISAGDRNMTYELIIRQDSSANYHFFTTFCISGDEIFLTIENSQEQIEIREGAVLEIRNLRNLTSKYNAKYLFV